jgi:hypothetical protein
MWRTARMKYLVLDGVEGKHYEAQHFGTGITEAPVFSRDGSKVAYSIATKERQYFMIKDGKEEGPYRSIASGSLTFSPDGKRLAYVAQMGRKYFLVLDGVPSKEGYLGTSYFAPPVFSNDGKDVVFAAAFLCINGKLEMDGTGVVPGGIKFVGPRQFQHITLGMDDTIRVVHRRIVRD